ncbi:alpha-1,2 mannosyltransferase Ktr1p [[Candida] anglica]|uniref:Alpha-1,2 mannosyltransferase Ktr1p n=1 Tax=[Candida] anglica TaxID=148631 RepID=A0ABP0EFM0_9ASCO
MASPWSVGIRPKRISALLGVVLILFTIWAYTWYSFDLKLLEVKIPSKGGDTKIEDMQDDKGVLFSLVRNEELDGMLSSIGYVQKRYNNQFHSDWVFANDKPFTEEFKQKVTKTFTSGRAIFVRIPVEYWSYPEHIDLDRAAESRTLAQSKGMAYGGSEEYRHMCRFNSGFFYKLEALKPYRYYWRIEPNVKFVCNFKEDPFEVMKNNSFIYGWTMTMGEFADTVPTLWDTTQTFLKKNNGLISKKNMYNFVTDDNGDTYNLCHYWSNFEIGDLEFYRSKDSPYEKYFQYLDKAGGFFYERWGDAPVHSIAMSLFVPSDKIYHFANTGYYHKPNQGCPVDEFVRQDLQCDCNPRKDFTFHKFSCTRKYYKVKGLEFPGPAED